MTVTIAPITEEDIKALYPMGSTKAISWMSGGGLKYPTPYAEFRTKNTIAVSDDVGEQETWVINHKGEPAGSIGYFRRENDSPLEIGYWLGEPFWGMGIASKALMLALDAIRLNGVTGVITATALKENIGSAKVLQKCGFDITGEENTHSPARDMMVDVIHYKVDL